MELFALGILLVVAVGAIVLGTRGVFARDLTRALVRVNQQEQELQEKADILEQRLTQIERDYHAKLKRADVEAERLIQEAKTQAMNIRAVGIDEAKQRARQVLLEAEQGKGQLKAELARELDGQAFQRAAEVLRDLLPQAELQRVHHTLTDSLLEALQQMDVEPMKPTVERVDVTTALPLAPEAARRLTQWASTAFGARVGVQVHMDPSLVAGCLVRVGTTVVESTLVARLRQEGHA